MEHYRVIMLRYSFVLLAVVAVSGPAAAGTWADGMFEELSKDFGPVPRGPMMKHAFKFVNNTGQPLSISNVRVSCGCVTASASHHYVEPGATAFIHATMDTTRFHGFKNVTIFVQFDRPKFDEVRLWVQWNGRDDFSVTPEQLAFGSVKRASQPEREVVITFFGDTSIALREIHTDSNYVKAIAREIQRGNGQVAYRMSATVRADTPVGKWFSDIWLITNNPNMAKIRVPLTIEIESALTVSPDNVALGVVKRNDSASKRVIVRGVKPFTITKIEGTDANLIVQEANPGAHEVHVLNVRLKSPSLGDFARDLKIVTDLEGDNEVTLGVTARVLGE